MINSRIFRVFTILVFINIYLFVITGCNFVELKIVNTSIMDKGDGTSDSYSKDNEMADKETISLEAELMKEAK